MRVLRSVIAAVVIAMPASAVADAPARVAVFDFELIDTSLEGGTRPPRADEQRRLRAISDQLRAAVAASAIYEVVDIQPAAADIQAAGYLHGCNGCEADIARELGAALAITGTVQKVSNLILNFNLYVRDAETGERRRAMSVDIRGNTDESWRRGMSYLLRNRLLRDDTAEKR